jgi:hypothetical protein
MTGSSKTATTILALALLLQVGLIARSRGGIEIDVPPDFDLGTRLPNAPLRGEGKDITLAELTEGSCALLLFFQSQCPACNSVAEHWKTKAETTTASGDTLPITFVAFSTDTSALAFMQRHELSAEWYRLKSERWRKKLRVNRWPLVYLVKDGVLVDLPPRTPEALAQYPTPVECMT